MAPYLQADHEPETHGAENVAADSPRFIVIGAGSRGNSYSRAVTDSAIGTIVAVADPIPSKRQILGSKYIWRTTQPAPEQEFSDWKDFIKYEHQRRKDESAGIPVPKGVDGAFVCVLDEQHVEAITSLAPLGLHILGEKPLATSLEGCLRIQKAIESGPPSIFAIGHVLRYSPHNMLLRNLVLEKKVIGDILSIEHTEPVGWWHFSHSYVRGNWRKESRTAPSLLTKSCHDIDFIFWMLCSPPSGRDQHVHLPSRFSSFGSLKEFRRSRKPKEAGDATNCLSCKLRDTCMYSAKRIYHDRHLDKGKVSWPIHIVNPNIEPMWQHKQYSQAHDALMGTLAEDYDAETTPVPDIEERPWYGRCVWESDNDVVDDQYVTIEWDDDPSAESEVQGRTSKTASFHMIAQTRAQCERRGRLYGRTGEIHYDSKAITVHDFTNDATEVYNAEVPQNSHHGGGDIGLTQQFVKAVISVKEGKMDVNAAQVEFLGCTMEDIIRSHAAVFCAEEARISGRVIDWQEWWHTNVEQAL
ncbi:NAD binding Rossmann fold oxidoreductase-like protein [Polychaeton citri CBS 116435]|uniref:NAD binding Rossmann fold oxidoreductase-like protein n=1 Tax=Polychaeton citri CBS 116435 TaxID=1314669 RepID=A0A9P4QDU8_9PEZI|nr:NAD binding Rossmann fold oxidoreductase-like protein [Polychaeton citri CBS 116435]